MQTIKSVTLVLFLVFLGAAFSGCEDDSCAWTDNNNTTIVENNISVFVTSGAGATANGGSSLATANADANASIDNNGTLADANSTSIATTMTSEDNSTIITIKIIKAYDINNTKCAGRVDTHVVLSREGTRREFVELWTDYDNDDEYIYSYSKFTTAGVNEVVFKKLKPGAKKVCLFENRREAGCAYVTPAQ